MSCSNKSSTFAVVLLLVGLVAPLAGNDNYAPVVGQYHPELVLPSIDGGAPVSLGDYRGTKVLLIHFASW